MTDRPQGWFTDDDGAFYRELCHSARLLVEVGVWRGRSLSHVCGLPDLRIFAVDTWQTAIMGQDPSEARQDFLAFANERALFPRLQIIVEPSVEASRGFEPASVDVVFVDACHDYEAVSDDLDAWWPIVKPNGWIGGHDYNEHHVKGVVRAVNAFAVVHDRPIRTGGDCWAIRKPKGAAA